MVSFSAVFVFALAAVAFEVSGQIPGVSIPPSLPSLPSLPIFSSSELSSQAQSGSNTAPLGITIPGLSESSFSIKSTPGSKAIGGTAEIEENGIKILIQLGKAGGVQAEIVAPILPSITDIIKLAQKIPSNAIGFLKAIVNHANNVALEVVNNIVNLLKAVGKPIQTLVKGAGSLINKAIQEGFITAEKANEIVTNIIKSALSNTLNRFAELVDLLQYAVNKKLILEEEALTVVAEAANQGVHLIQSGIDFSLEGFLNATAQAKVINENVANTLKNILKGNSTIKGASSKTALGSDSSSSESVESKDGLQIDVNVIDS